MGYRGAIQTGRTICGALFGGTVFHGYFNGMNATDVPDINDEKRTRAIESVQGLFNGFNEKFGDTDCQTLIGCDWGKKEDIERYYKEEIYKDKCFKYFEYVLANCMAIMSARDKS